MSEPIWPASGFTVSESAYSIQPNWDPDVPSGALGPESNTNTTGSISRSSGRMPPSRQAAQVACWFNPMPMPPILLDLEVLTLLHTAVRERRSLRLTFWERACGHGSGSPRPPARTAPAPSTASRPRNWSGPSTTNAIAYSGPLLGRRLRHDRVRPVRVESVDLRRHDEVALRQPVNLVGPQ